MMIRFLLLLFVGWVALAQVKAQPHSEAEEWNQCVNQLKLAKELANRNKPEEANKLIHETLTLARKIPHERVIFDLHNVFVTTHLRTWSEPQAIEYAQEIKEEAASRGSTYGKNVAEFALVRYYTFLGKTDSAMAGLGRILRCTPFDSINIAKALATRGNVWFRKGNLKEAMTDYVRCAELAEGQKDDALASVVLGSIGSLHQELGNYRSALDYQKKAAAVRLRLGLKADLAGALNNIANLFHNRLKNNDSAFIYYRKALQLFTSLNDNRNLAMALNNLGNHFTRVHRHDSAVYYLGLANTLFGQLKDSVNLAINYLDQGTEREQYGKTQKSRPDLEKALRLYEEAGKIIESKSLTNLKMPILKGLSQVHEDLGNLEQSHSFLQQYSGLADSVRATDLSTKIAELQARYETEKKEREIVRLSTENRLEAEMLARERTLNYSLAAIAVLLMAGGYLLFFNIQKKRKAEAKLAVLEKQNAIETMRGKIAGDVHDDMGANLTKLGLNAQQLLSISGNDRQKELAEKIATQSKEVIIGMREIIWASNPANDNLKSMLGFMRQYIDRFFDGTEIRPVIRFPHEVGEISLHPEVRRNLFLILKESLNNTVKYAETDRVEIDFTNQNDRFNFQIKDFGKGMDENKTDDFSNGLRNMKARAEEIAAAFSLVTRPGKGVEILVEGRLY
ncbi:MAG TPA: tetratricopeptide repeat protein [Catalimonadaceae bacterium]|nr:tetratricopeptide repeat protein [Catalimonadaceae bacterium]